MNTVRRKDLPARLVEGHALVLCGADVVHLDESATLVWELLAASMSLEELADRVVAATGAPRDVVRGDLVALIQRLSSIGLVHSG